MRRCGKRYVMLYRLNHIAVLEYTKETSALAEEFNRYFISVGRKASTASVNLAEIHGLSSAFEVPDGNNISCDDAFEFRAGNLFRGWKGDYGHAQ